MSNSIDVLINLDMLESGIIPYGWPRGTLKEGLDSLDEPTCRCMKRKFRKLWRKALKRYKRIPDVYENVCRQAGVGLSASELEVHHYIFRSRLVYLMFHENAKV